MADELKTIRQEVGDLLQGIEGLHVYPSTPPGDFRLPAALVFIDTDREGMPMGGSSFRGLVRISLLAAASLGEEAYAFLDSMLSPLGTRSVEAAVDADVTLDGAVDYMRYESMENYGPREIYGGWYIAADVVMSFTKQVLT